MNLPDTFTQRITSVYGDAGRAWLDALPSLLDAIAGEWGLTLGEPFDPSYSYVAAVRTADGTDAVLKARVPSEDLGHEIAALRCYAGRGAVRLLRDDVERGVMLLERIAPGTLLADLEDDEQATAIAADLMQTLTRPTPADHTFPTIDDWGEEFARLRQMFNGGSGPLPARLYSRAEATFHALAVSSAPPVLLHGDLHHFNILRAQSAAGGWLAIDPHGVVGEPAYETGALLRSPNDRLLDMPDPARTLARRVDIMAERLGFDRQRIIGWAMSQAVLSAVWTIVDGEPDWRFAIAVAEIFAAMS